MVSGIYSLIFFLCSMQHPAAESAHVPENNKEIIENSLFFSEYQIGKTAEITAPVTIPVRFVGNLMLVECSIDSIKGYLVFDTGASEILLNKVYFRKYASRPVRQSTGITGYTGEVSTITVNNIRISDLEFNKITTQTADLGHLENRRNVKILGLINFELFKSCKLIIDARQGILQLIPESKDGIQQDSISSWSENHDCKMKFSLSQNIIFVQGSIAKKKIRFCIDTGAETNVLNSHCPQSVLKTIAITGKTNLCGSGQGQCEVLNGVMNELEIGGNKLNNMKTIIVNLDPLNETYGYYIDGMLGYPFIRKCVLYINFAEQTIGIDFYKEDNY